MNIKIENGSFFLGTILFLLLQVFFWFINRFQFSDFFPTVTALLWVALISAYVLMTSACTIRSSSCKSIIIISYLLKTFVLCVNLLSNHSIERILNITDPSGFRAISLLYQQGDFSQSLTLYPYILSFQYSIFGNSWFVAALVNIMLSTLGVIYTVRIIEDISSSQMYRGDLFRGKVWIVIEAMSPYVLVHSVTLLRESFYFFTTSVSFFFFVRYIFKKRECFFVCAVIFSLSAVVLHPGNIVVTICYFISYLELQKEKIRWFRLPAKLMFFIPLSLIVAVVAVQLLRNGATGYGMNHDDIYSFLQGSYSAHFDSKGGSRYLNWMPTPSNFLQIVLFTPLRMVYFLFSPLITNWRGPKDILSFILDSMIHLYSLFSICSMIRCERGKMRVIAKTALYLVLMTALAFCWETTTAGSAIRHRLWLIPVECCICVLWRMCRNRPKEFRSAIA